MTTSPPWRASAVLEPESPGAGVLSGGEIVLSPGGVPGSFNGVVVLPLAGRSGHPARSYRLFLEEVMTHYWKYIADGKWPEARVSVLVSDSSTPTTYEAIYSPEGKYWCDKFGRIVWLKDGLVYAWCELPEPAPKRGEG